jgi:hypothetical protein
MLTRFTALYAFALQQIQGCVTFQERGVIEETQGQTRVSIKYAEHIYTQKLVEKARCNSTGMFPSVSSSLAILNFLLLYNGYRG